jgi:hypothetical protein
MAISFPPSNKEIITLTATCHCTLFHTTFTLPSSSLPLKASLCHCTTCRKTAGHILPTWAVIPSSDRPDVSALTAYASSDTLLRFFCPRCGASIAGFEAEEWDIATGVLDRTCDGLLNRVQLWLEDTKDGGAGLWLNDTHYERFIQGRNSDKLAFEDVRGIAEGSRKKSKVASSDSDSAQQEHKDVEEDCLNASCRCGAVSFQILRPDTDSNGNGSNKYPAGLDACKSCRTVTGCEITSWAFVPRDRIRTFVESENNNSNNQDSLDLLNTPPLSYYKTSPAVTRGFCSTCGANVFYYRHRGRTGKGDTIDIAAGLLESGAGVRAEDWLVWDHYGEDVVAYREDALDRGLVEGLVRGITEDGGS